MWSNKIEIGKEIDEQVTKVLLILGIKVLFRLGIAQVVVSTIMWKRKTEEMEKRRPAIQVTDHRMDVGLTPESKESEDLETGSCSRKTARRSTGVGGKTPRLAINFKQVRKKSKKAKSVQECFDVDDDEDEEAGSFQVQEDDEVALVENNSGYCDVCGQDFKNRENLEEHLSAHHGLLTCRYL